MWPVHLGHAAYHFLHLSFVQFCVLIQMLLALFLLARGRLAPFDSQFKHLERVVNQCGNHWLKNRQPLVVANMSVNIPANSIQFNAYHSALLVPAKCHLCWKAWPTGISHGDPGWKGDFALPMIGLICEDQSSGNSWWSVTDFFFADLSFNLIID